MYLYHVLCVTINICGIDCHFFLFCMFSWKKYVINWLYCNAKFARKNKVTTSHIFVGCVGLTYFHCPNLTKLFQFHHFLAHLLTIQATHRSHGFYHYASLFCPYMWMTSYPTYIITLVSTSFNNQRIWYFSQNSRHHSSLQQDGVT
jgi:hypothetical protein